MVADQPQEALYKFQEPPPPPKFRGLEPFQHPLLPLIFKFSPGECQLNEWERLMPVIIEGCNSKGGAAIRRV